MKKKLSFDLTAENTEALEEIKNKQHLPFGQTINMLIDLFCRLPLDICEELLCFCKSQMQDICKKMDRAGEYEAQNLVNKYQIYSSLAQFFNQGERVYLQIEEEPKMKKIEMEDGVLVCPVDFIVLNEEDAKCCTHASVTEVIMEGKDVPHFLFFDNIDANKYDKYDRERIERLCTTAWPQFREVLDAVVEPIKDPDMENGEPYLNQDEYDKAPLIGHFSVYVQGSNKYNKNYKPPMGVRIIKDKGRSEDND